GSFLEPTTSARRGSLSSAITAIPTFGFCVTSAYAVTCAPACVSALKSVVFPELGRPTRPTRSGITQLVREADAGLACVSLHVQHALQDEGDGALLGVERERPRATRAELAVERIGAVRRHEPAEDLSSGEAHLDPNELVSHSQPPP